MIPYLYTIKVIRVDAIHIYQNADHQFHNGIHGVYMVCDRIILNLDNSLLIGGGLTICVIYLAATYVYYRSKFKNSKKAKRSRKKSKKR